MSRKEFSSKPVSNLHKLLKLQTPVVGYDLTAELKELAEGGGGLRLQQFQEDLNLKVLEMSNRMLRLPGTSTSTFSVRLPQGKQMKMKVAVLSCLQRFIWNACVEWTKSGVITVKKNVATLNGLQKLKYNSIIFSIF